MNTEKRRKAEGENAQSATTTVSSWLAFAAVTAVTALHVAPLVDLAALAFIAVLAWAVGVPLTIVLALTAAAMSWDRHAPHRGGTRCWDAAPGGFLRLLSICLMSYYPVRIVAAKGAVIDPKKNYIIDAHPHPVNLSCAVGAAFSEALHAALPGARFQAAVSNWFFRAPLLRHVLLSAGSISVDEHSMRYALQRPGSGKAVLLFSGVAEELLGKRNDSVYVFLKRTGFCRLALLEGASLIPLIILGDHLAYRQPFPDLQRRFFSRVNFPLYVCFGRDPFQDRFGILPHRVPQTFVFGAPLDVEQTPNPTREQVLELHGRFVAAMRALYEEYSPVYSPVHVPLVLDSR